MPLRAEAAFAASPDMAPLTPAHGLLLQTSPPTHPRDSLRLSWRVSDMERAGAGLAAEPAACTVGQAGTQHVGVQPHQRCSLTGHAEQLGMHSQKSGRHCSPSRRPSNAGARGTRPPAPTCGRCSSVGSGGGGMAGELSATGPRLRTACDTAGERCRLATPAGGASGAAGASAAAAVSAGEASSPLSASTTAGGLCSTAAGAGMAGVAARGVAAAAGGAASGAASLGAAGAAWEAASAALPLTAVITKS